MTIPEEPLNFPLWLLSLLFPVRCGVCGGIVTKPWHRLCPKCEEKLPLLEGETCPRCARRMTLCSCKSRDTIYRAAAALEYDQVTMRLLWNFKFLSHRSLANLLSQLMEERRKEFFGDEAFDCITFVPMSGAARRRRGYNQAQLLAKGVGKLSGIPLRELLRKIRSNQPQHELSRSQRRQNVQGIYGVPETVHLKGENVLLVDDILTTGSTVEECTRVLLTAGAGKVSVLCAASSLPKESKRYPNEKAPPVGGAFPRREDFIED